MATKPSSSKSSIGGALRGGGSLPGNMPPSSPLGAGPMIPPGLGAPPPDLGGPMPAIPPGPGLPLSASLGPSIPSSVPPPVPGGSMTSKGPPHPAPSGKKRKK